MITEQREERREGDVTVVLGYEGPGLQDARLVTISRFHKYRSQEPVVEVNWPGMGGRSIAVTEAFIEVLQRAVEVARELQPPVGMPEQEG